MQLLKRLIQGENMAVNNRIAEKDAPICDFVGGVVSFSVKHARGTDWVQLCLHCPLLEWTKEGI